MEKKIAVAGAGGFIGGHLVNYLRSQGHKNLRGIDNKPLEHWFQRFEDVENLVLDLQKEEACQKTVEMRALA